MPISRQLRAMRAAGKPALRRAAAQLARQPDGPGAVDVGGLRRALEAPGPISPAALHVLQQAHGNRAVQRLIDAARVVEPAPPRRRPQAGPEEAAAPAPAVVQRKPAGPLSPAQVEQARQWYAANRQRYTPAIITQIQEAVGADPDGVIGSQTIQAVAVFQSQNPHLAVDGIAGPRTLPALFPAGLAEAESIEEYVEDARGVQEGWAGFPGAEERARALGEAVNAKLEAAGVPRCAIAVRDIGQNSGQFDFATWTLELGQGPFSAETISDAEAADIADTVYHEARHAEQWFRMAQLRAGQGKSAADIAGEMGIPPEIAAAAGAAPLAPGSMEALIAQGWYDSVYGRNAEARNQTLEDLEARGNERDAAREAYENDPTPENERKLNQAQRRFDRAYARYRNLPEEADAWHIGGQVTDEYLSEQDADE